MQLAQEHLPDKELAAGAHEAPIKVYIRKMEKQMETTIVGHIGIM